jgi:predicted Na+-dependent transporter
MLLVLRFCVVALLFAMGLLASPRDLAYLWHRPALLARSLLAMYVAVPVLAVAMARALDLPRGTELAIVILAICAGAPLLPRKLLKLGGEPSYVLSLVVTTSLLAIVTVPLSLRLLAGVVNLDTELGPGPVAWAILKSFLLPLGAGMLVRALLPGVAARAAEPLLGVAGGALAVVSIVLLVAGWRLLAEVDMPSLLAFGAFALGSLALGHLLGGPAPETRTSLAVACTTRHVGLALLVGANARGPRTLSLVAGYLVATALVSLPYIRWRRQAATDRTAKLSAT